MQHMSRDRTCESPEVTNSEICSAIDEHIRGKNAARNREILKRRLIDGICFEPLAEEFGISTRQCKRIVYTCMEKLIKYI